MFELMDTTTPDAIIKVIGVGGGGGNAVEYMRATGVEGVEFICANTDAQVLQKIEDVTTLQIGTNITKGLGAGTNPETGRQAALEDRERIQEAIGNADMVFITAGMGGGTGTGAAPVVAQVARDMGVLTVGVVTKPFNFEGKKRMSVAVAGIHELAEHVDSLITIPNDKLIASYGRDFNLMDAFHGANNVLHGAVLGISELITRPGLINVDFADVRTVMSQMGTGMMGSGRATGEDRAREATAEAVASPLLEDVDLSGAQGILVNITAKNMSLGEFQDIGDTIAEFAADEANVVIGTAVDEALEDELRVTVVATGLGMLNSTAAEPTKAANSLHVVRKKDGEIDYSKLDKPAVQRRSIKIDSQSDVVQAGVVGSTNYDNDILDIPAFLRKQAD